MSVSDYFSTFCSNLRMSSDIVSTIQSRYHQITKRINLTGIVRQKHHIAYMLVHMEGVLKYGQVI